VFHLIDLAGSHDRTSLRWGVARTDATTIRLRGRRLAVDAPLQSARVQRARRPWFLPGHVCVFLVDLPAGGSVRFTALPAGPLARQVEAADFGERPRAE
jgi:hypothetical protein